MKHWTLAWIAVPLLAGASWMGCSSESNSAPGAASTAAGATSGTQTVVAPVGPFPRGTASPQNTPDPATVGPELTPVSPTRGGQTDQASIAVVISAVDPDGVASVTIAGVAATSLGNDRWEALGVSLEVGMNVVTFEAEDSLGNRTSGYLSVTRGQLVSTNQVFARSMTAALTPAGLDTVCDIAEGELTKLDLENLIKQHNPLVRQTGLKLTGTKLDYDPIQVELEGAPTGLRARAHLDNVRLECAAEFIGFGLTTVIITANRATAVVDAQVDQGLYTGTARVSHQGMGLEFDSIQISFQGFDATTSSGFFSALLSPFRGSIERTVQSTLETILLDLVSDALKGGLVGLDSDLSLGMTNPLTQTNHSMNMRFEVHEAAGSNSTGVVLSLGARGQAQNPIAGSPSTYVSLGVPAPRPMVPGPEAFGIRLSSDGLNAFLHEIWRTGGVAAKIEGRNPTPGMTISLSAGMLYPFLPVVRDLAPDPDTPLTIEVGIGAAPMIGFGQQPGVPYQLSLGEAEARVLIDYMDGNPPAHLFSLRFAATAQVDLVVANDKITIDNLQAKVDGVDVTEEPTVDIREQEIEDFLLAILPQILDSYKASFPPIPLPALPFGLSIQNPRLLVDPGYVTIYGDL